MNEQCKEENKAAAKSIQKLFDLRGRTAIVTGGAGLYGKQIVEALAESGARTIMASRNLEKLRKQAEAFSRQGVNVEVLQYDQSSEASILGLRDQAVALMGRVDVLVNNAVLRCMDDWTSPVADFTRSMEANATGLFLMSRAFGEHMASRGQGSIINVGSLQGMVGPDYSLYEGLDIDWGIDPDYFMHKGGLIQLTRFAASKLGPRGVRVNAISPGGLLTNQNPTFVARYNARTFLGRMANNTDLKGVIAFLASDASAYITGANIPIDGGYTAK